MKRRLLTVLLFLFLGVIVNIAVAWGIARWAPPIPITQSSEDANHRLIQSDSALAAVLWDRYAPDEWRAATPGGGYEEFATGRFTRVVQGIPAEGPAHMRVGVEEDRYGWPRLSLFSSQLVSLDVNTLQSRIRVKTGWHPGGNTEFVNQAPDHILPLGVVWPEFLINTLFYAFILWLFIRGPFVLRRHLRLKRGHCLKCGYDLQGLPPDRKCPECGWNREKAGA